MTLPEPILVTGAGGFLGAVVVALLSECRIRCIPVHRIAESAPEGAIACNLSSPALVSGLLEEYRPLAIVNCAAIVDFSAGTLAQHYSVNSLLPALLGAWARENNAHLVQASTVAVQGTNSEYISADSQIVTDTDYGQGKYLGETMINGSGCRATVLRFAGIYGPGGPNHLRLNVTIDRALEGTIPELAGSGDSRRNYIHVVDAARAILFSIENNIFGVHLAASREILSVRQMLEVICDTLLDGCSLIHGEGTDGLDQIVEPSAQLPGTKSMSECLAR